MSSTTSKCGEGRACFAACAEALPMAGLITRSVTLLALQVEMCVTMDSKELPTRHCIALCKAPKFHPRPPATQHHQWLLGSVLRAKVQRFRNGDLVDSRWEFANLLSTRLQSQCVSCMTVTPSSDVLFPPGGKRH